MLNKKNWDSMTSEELKTVINYWESLRGCRVNWTKNAVHIIGIPKELFLAVKIDDEALNEYLKNDAEKMKKISRALYKAGYSASEIADLMDSKYLDVKKYCEEMNEKNE